MERDRKLKHCCKICGKSFPYGRSLGGHMRSHLALNSSTEVEARLQSSRSSIWVEAGYDLRENPKKTWRLWDSGSQGSPRHDKLCRKCGKGFLSWKYLFGHMRCHPDKSHHNLEEGKQEQELEEQQRSWSGAGGQSVNEVMIPRRRRRSRRVASISASSTPVLELEKEQEDVARSLMMLSRDTSFWSGISSAAESDKNSVVLENLSSERDEIGKGKKRSEFISSRNGNRRDGLKKVESDVSYDDGFVKDEKFKKPKAYASDIDEFEYSNEASRKGSLKKKDLNYCLAKLEKKTGFDQLHSGVGKYSKSGSRSEFDVSKDDFSKVSMKRGRYECTACNKFFPSYQALGGHRASHKRMKVLFASRIEASNNSLEIDASIKPARLEELVEKKVGLDTSSEASKKVKSHECPICRKVFSSSQSLRGHRKSHLVASSDGGGLTHQTIVIQQQPLGMPFDLNLPTPTNEGSSNTNGNLKFRSWWVGRNHEHGSLSGLISN
ncbi:zinc finger protein ZAT1-like [Phoenix dactylifera]|uniref:Zinc finger protein ZAT1-like n=1 Tax=Phoenix dactylifera TaxID=42345 RepID=A0A8B8JAI0_PHODC|nr:zinc finger protein ZAT1-like [Phoenix dactylifera]